MDHFITHTFQAESNFIQPFVSRTGEHSLQLFEIQSSHTNSFSSLQ